MEDQEYAIFSSATCEQMNPLHAKIVDEFPDANKAPAFFAPYEPIFFVYASANEQKLFSFMLGFLSPVV